MIFKRPPSKEKVKEFLERFDETTPNSAHWTHDDVDLLVRAYRYQEILLKDAREDMRDAGRELRELEQERARAEQDAYDARYR